MDEKLQTIILSELYLVFGLLREQKAGAFVDLLVLELELFEMGARGVQERSPFEAGRIFLVSLNLTTEDVKVLAYTIFFSYVASMQVSLFIQRRERLAGD